MDDALQARALGLEERADEKGMSGELDDTHVAVAVEAGEAEAGEGGEEVAVEAVAAVIPLGRSRRAVNRANAGLFVELDHPFFLDERALQGRNDMNGSAGIGFGMCRSGYP